MAIQKGNSGTFNIYTKNQYISGYVAWQETYDDSNYSTTNETTVTMDVYLHRTNIYSGETSVQGVAGTRIAYFDSEEVRDDSAFWLAIPGNSSSSGGAYSKVYSASKVIKHNDDGSKAITLGYYMTNNWIGGSAGNAFAVDKTTSNVTLMKIPRFANITKFNVAQRDETSVYFDWSADVGCDSAWYSKDDGVNWQGLPVNNVVSGLNAGELYNFKLRVRRTDSQLVSESGTSQQRTYYYPHCVGSRDFTIGKPLKLDFYNPLNRDIYVEGIAKSNNSAIFTGNTNGNYLYGFNDPNSVVRQYESIPESAEGTYKVKVSWNNHDEIRDVGNKYYINPADCKPNFNDFDYATDIVALTGNYETIINGKTSTTINVPVNKKATGAYGSYIKKYRFECGSQKKELDESANNDVIYIMPNCTSQTLKVTAIDSRGQETTVTKNVTNFKTYYKPSFASIKAERNNGVDTESYLSAEINFWNGNFGSADNKIVRFSYKTKPKTSNEYGSSILIDTANLIYDGDKVILDKFLIHENGTSGGFAIGVAYDIQLGVIDGSNEYWLESAEGNAVLTDGKVGFSLLKDSDGNYHVGIDGMPDTEAPLFIKGKNPMVKVSPTEPTTGEEVWIQKSKNIFDATTMFEFYHQFRLWDTGWFIETNEDFNGIKVPVKENTWYSFSSDASQKYSLAYYDANFNYISGRSFTTGPAFETPLNCKYITLGVGSDATWIQIEEGTTVTEYEPYVGKKIYVKNDNGSYEEFYNEETLKDISFDEKRIGTYFGKPYYCRVIKLGGVGSNNAQQYVYGGNFKKVPVANIFLDHPNTGNTVTLPTVLDKTSTYFDASAYAENGNVVIQTYRPSGGLWSDWDIYVYVEYTKTTD